MRKLIFVLLVAVLASCNSPKEKSVQLIKALESKDSAYNDDAIERLKAAYLDFVDNYPDDDSSPEYLLRSAQYATALDDSKEAISLLDKIAEKYPKSAQAEKALFLKGFTLENNLQQFDEAKNVYEEFLKKYPNSELKEDAQTAIINLGKSPEQLLKEFTERNN